MIARTIGKISVIWSRPLIRNATLLFRPFHGLATDTPIRDHNNSTKKKISKQNTNPSHEEGDIPKKKSESSKRNRKLWEIIQEYRQVLEGSGQVKTTLSLCRKVTRHYSRDRIGQFRSCKPDLQRLVTTLSGLPFKDLSLTQHYSVLDLLGVLQDMQLLKRNALGTVKDIIFMNLQPFFQKLDGLSLSDLCGLYAAVLPFNHPHLAALAERISLVLAQKREELEPQLAEAVIVALRRRVFLSPFDFALFKTIIQRFEQNSTKLPLNQLAKIYQAIEWIGGTALFGDHRSLINLDHFQKIFLPKLQEVSYDDPSILYLVQADFCAPRVTAPFQIILEKVLKRMQSGQMNGKILKVLIGCLQRIKFSLDEQQIDTILGLLTRSYKDQKKRQSVFAEKSLEIVVLDLLQCGIFDTFLNKLEGLINEEFFDVKWSIILAYSLKNIPFPLKKLQAKINPKTSNFTSDSNYIKSAVSIGIQHHLYPESSILSSSFKQTKGNLQKQSLRQSEMVWLAHQCNINPEAMKAFHTLYYSCFSEQLQLFQIAKNPNFYYYLITCQSSNTCNPEYIRQINAAVLEMIIEKAHWNHSYINEFLLYVLHRKLHIGTFSPKSQTGLAVIRLLLHYSRIVHTAPHEAFIAYHKLLMQALHSYNEMKASHLQLDLVIKRMLVPPTVSSYHQSQEHIALINECIKQLHLISDMELIVIIIRSGLIRGIMKRAPGNCKFKRGFLTEQEIKVLSEGK